jgi:hypothetical protein
MPPRSRRRAAPTLLALALLAHTAGPLSGCVVVGRNTVGSVPSAAVVAGVAKGAEIGEVVQRLGAPVDLSLAPDGMLLIWRERRYDYDRLEIDPSQGLSFLSVDPILGSALSNLKLILERGILREERVAVLFDRDGRVVAVSQRDGENRRLR